MSGILVPDKERLFRRGLLYLVASDVCFWASLIVCYLLLPKGDLHRHGISLYGNFRASIVPYGAGLLLSAGFMVLGANVIPAREWKLVAHKRLLRAIAALLVALFLTPSSFGRIVGGLHTAAGSTLFVCQFMFGLNVYLSAWRSWLIAALFTVLILGSLLSLMSLLNVVSLMFGGQIVTELAFSFLLVFGTARLLSDEGNLFTPPGLSHP